ncbi:MAG: hypothetical protein MN733_24735 [Nitrososphaera sp.]|nr:hypothetical protein [Nitrososphaera sp.]
MLLVTAVAIMGSFLVAWSSSSFGIAQRDIANSTDSKINQVRENFVVEDVWFYTKTIPPPDTKYANVTIRNTGDVAIRISHIYVNNTQAWNAGQTISHNTAATIQVQTNWGSNDLQSIWVKTYRGSEVKQIWKS